MCRLDLPARARPGDVGRLAPRRLFGSSHCARRATASATEPPVTAPKGERAGLPGVSTDMTATDKQLAYLAELGLPGRDRASKITWLREQGLTAARASILIEQARVGSGAAWDDLCDAAMDDAIAEKRSNRVTP